MRLGNKTKLLARYRGSARMLNNIYFFPPVFPQVEGKGRNRASLQEPGFGSGPEAHIRQFGLGGFDSLLRGPRQNCRSMLLNHKTPPAKKGQR